MLFILGLGYFFCYFFKVRFGKVFVSGFFFLEVGGLEEMSMYLVNKILSI